MKTPKGWVVIYALKDPRNGRVRYVGQTSDPEARETLHARPSYAINPKMREWILALRARGLRPRLSVIGTAPITSVDARPPYILAERFAIRWYVEAGASLFNYMGVLKRGWVKHRVTDGNEKKIA